jgi:hypothetical protein
VTLTASVEVPWITFSFDFGDDGDVGVCSLGDIVDLVPAFFQFPGM